MKPTQSFTLIFTHVPQSVVIYRLFYLKCYHLVGSLKVCIFDSKLHFQLFDCFISFLQYH